MIGLFTALCVRAWFVHCLFDRFVAVRVNCNLCLLSAVFLMFVGLTGWVLCWLCACCLLAVGFVLLLLCFFVSFVCFYLFHCVFICLCLDRYGRSVPG